MMWVILLIITALFAAALLVLVVVQALAVAEKRKAYKRAADGGAGKKPVTGYRLEIVQQGGHVTVESGNKIVPTDARGE